MHQPSANHRFYDDETFKNGHPRKYRKGNDNMRANPIHALSIAAILLPTLAFAQNAQTPPTDPQSKRQQESPVVNAPAPSTSTTTGATTATPPDGNTTGTNKVDPPITSTSPQGGNPKANTDKKGPLQPSN
jgi:cytoskeletal protein RodZ